MAPMCFYIMYFYIGDCSPGGGQSSAESHDSQPPITRIRPPQTGHPALPWSTRSSQVRRIVSSSETPPVCG